MSFEISLVDKDHLNKNVGFIISVKGELKISAGPFSLIGITEIQ
jgi:hypothetical protein